VTAQTAGQALLIFGFLAWLAAWLGLAFYGVLAAHRRCWAAMALSKVLSGVLLAAGITAMYQIPGSIQ
jgi:hypothetical protein